MTPDPQIEWANDVPVLPRRAEEGHKGTFGKVLIVAGSVGMSGAAGLAGLGAVRGGAGLVFVATPNSVQPVVAGIEPSFLTVPLPESAEGTISRDAESRLISIAESCDAVAIGPGLGRSQELTELMKSLLQTLSIPMLIDADALNALAETGKFSGSGPADIRPQGEDVPRILTPHPGEFARLTGAEIAADEHQRRQRAFAFAKQHGVVLVLKGHRSLITDGQRMAENRTGNNGMATGGSGDVLTGLIAALLGQDMAAFDAARLGVHLHGLAGDLAAAELSQPGMIASDLPKFLPAAWKGSGEP